ncbi:unnamed protein product [Effrenium voratum]|uniref:F-box domain-containing protein n=1 Tax=Effrenium voratum TaxID=2562239 RepID=A0AA36IAB4_9DINO|nr:unnamed protein product [Effrenium voratum]
MAMLGRHLLELPPSALEICADWLTASEFLSLRRTSRSALHSGVFSAGCVPRLRCLVRKGEMTGEAVSRLYFPSLKVIVLHASLRELNSIVRNLCCKAAELRNLEVLRLEAPARHHLGDTSVRMLATAMRSWPCLRELGLRAPTLQRPVGRRGGRFGLGSPGLGRRADDRLRLDAPHPTGCSRTRAAQDRPGRVLSRASSCPAGPDPLLRRGAGGGSGTEGMLLASALRLLVPPGFWLPQSADARQERCAPALSQRAAPGGRVGPTGGIPLP